MNGKLMPRIRGGQSVQGSSRRRTLVRHKRPGFTRVTRSVIIPSPFLRPPDSGLLFAVNDEDTDCEQESASSHATRGPRRQKAMRAAMSPTSHGYITSRGISINFGVSGK